MLKPTLRLMVQTREDVVFDSEVESVSSRNRKGVFDILDVHGNFIMLVDEVLRVRKRDGGEEEIKIKNGVLRVVKNKIEVYVGVKVLSGK